jgi:hypothetical protein
MSEFRASGAWIADCLHWHRRVLVGRYAHWCRAWDGQPVDETTPEWPCDCYDALVAARGEVTLRGEVAA